MQATPESTKGATSREAAPTPVAPATAQAKSSWDRIGAQAVANVETNIAVNREAWLGHMVERLRPVFAGLGYPLPEKIRFSCGWPSRGGTAKNRQTIGQAWSALASADGTHETFVSPVLGTAEDVGHVLVHELVHHAVGHACGHKGPFRALALAVGLSGKMTATVPTPELAVRLHALAAAIGPYPHATLDPNYGRRKQSTRMLKVVCPACGCVVRMTRLWLDDAGAPTCACGTPMSEPGGGNDEE